MAALRVKALTAYSSLWIDFFKFVINPLLLASCYSVSLSRVRIIASAFYISFVKSDSSTDIFYFVVCFTLRLFTFYFNTTSIVFSFAVWSLFLQRHPSMFYFNVSASPYTFEDYFSVSWHLLPSFYLSNSVCSSFFLRSFIFYWTCSTFDCNLTFFDFKRFIYYLSSALISSSVFALSWSVLYSSN
jgi:hypothetical protein